MAVLSVSATKRETYLLPLLAPLALLLALAVEERLATAFSSGGWRRAGEWLQAALLALLALVPGAAVLAYTRAPQAGALAVLLPAALVAVALLAATARRRTRRAALLSGAAALLFVVGALTVAMPALEAEKDFTPLIGEIDRALPAGAAVTALGADETLHGIVPFLTGRHVEAISVEDLEADLKGGTPPPFVLVQEKDRRLEHVPILESQYERVRSWRLGRGRGRGYSLWRRSAD